MTLTIVLDASPLSLLTQRPGVRDADECRAWLTRCLDAGHRVVLPAIADFEVRRELIRAEKHSSIARLDAIVSSKLAEWIPIEDAAMKRAAALWADARKQGLPTADRHALDCDVVLVAQAIQAGFPHPELVVATSNSAHLSRFVQARHWREID